VILPAVSMPRHDRGTRAATRPPLRAVFGATPLELLRDPRRTTSDAMERRVRAARDEDEVGSVVVFELDRIDELIADHGEAFVEQVLDQLESIIAGSFRATDPLTRVGMARFAVVVEGAPIGEAARRAERVRNEVQAARFDAPTAPRVWVTASAGCAALPREPEAVAEALATAEAALAAAARAGRNRVIATR
jgi:diguanylate cyclase (GGDEF)-like protein